MSPTACDNYDFGETPIPRQAPRVGRLDTAAGLLRESGRLYRAARRGDLAPGDASKLASVLALIARLVETNSLERRIARLEAERTIDGHP
jgi:hypothetical protein